MKGITLSALARWKWHVAAVGLAVAVVGAWQVHRHRAKTRMDEEKTVAQAPQPKLPAPMINELVRPSDSIERRGIPTDDASLQPTEEPAIFFPEAKESDHNNSADGEDFHEMKGQSTEYLGHAPGASGGLRGRKSAPGAYDSVGLGAGAAGAMYGGRMGAGAAPPGRGAPQADVPSNTEGYDSITENAFHASAQDPLSTFSIDVDTASYANARRFLAMGSLPPPDAVRIEELVNYFTYAYPVPTDDRPFAVHMEMASCPWNAQHQLLRIGLKGRTLDAGKRPPSNLVFLIDVSGSMEQSNKLPLVQQGLGLLIEQLTENDRVAMVVYAGNSGLVLAPTTGDKKAAIRAAIQQLRAGGSTNGGAGIELAYRLATDNFVKAGTNRVLLATDGDWNVGRTSHGDLQTRIAEKAKSGVFLSVLGFGMGNYKDDTLEMLADKGNGNYAYIDTLQEAKKVLVEQMAGTLCTIAKDVKIQVEFNPARIAGYRLIGYENRILAKEDFNDDKKDAGEIGAGHTVTALYELVPAGQEVPGGVPPVDPLKYQRASDAAAPSLDICTVKLRYKAPEAADSTLMEVPLKEGRARFDDASGDFRFAAAVAGYGMLLRRSQQAKGFTWDEVSEIASGAIGEDREGYRHEFLDLVNRAKGLAVK